MEPMEEKQAEYTFDIDQMQTTTELSEVHQEGNFLVAVSRTGVKFRQRIPQGKILVKEEGKYRLVDMTVAA